MTEANSLLREYVENGSEPAFRQLVTRYIDLVYSAALRRASGDAHRAQDIAQTVFIDLARKAPSLPADIMLGGWLHKHCCFVASTVTRTETRRAAREQEAAAMETPPASEATWTELAPALDDAIQQLDDEDRQAVILRFFERKDFRAIGETMGASENAAQKRVARAIEKLRASLGQAGVALSGAALATLLSDNALASAPAQFLENTLREAIKGSPAARGAAGKAAAGAGAFAFWKMAALFIAGAGVAGLLYANSLRSPRVNGAPFVAVGPGSGSNSNSTVPATSAPLSASAVEVAAPPSEIGLGLRLKVVTADTDAPIPNVPFEFWGFEAGKFVLKKFTTDRAGYFFVPYTTNLTQFTLTTRCENFADTRLQFRPDHGEKIPASFTLKLERGMRIAGKVVDPDGNPVAGAKVGFNHESSGEDAVKTVSNEFQWIEVPADENGLWEITRMTKPILKRLYGGATHPDFVPSKGGFFRQAPEAIPELLAGTYVFKLEPASVVRGKIVGEKGEPIAGAEVLVGERDMNTTRSAKSAPDGSFEVRGCVLGPTLLSANAKGFAATTIRIDTAKDEPHELVLKYGHVLRLVVTDKRSQPVAGAAVYLQTMGHLRSGKDGANDILPQVDFDKRTDKDGRIDWFEAPAGKLFFQVAAAGFMRSSDMPAEADGNDHRLVLADGLTIRGTVRDADTDAPLPGFRIITGWPNGVTLPGTAKPQLQWNTIDSFWLKFQNGAFTNTFTEYAINGVKEHKFVFRFEADGYKSEISRIVDADEGTVSFDIRLKKNAHDKLTVLDAGGRPVAGASIVEVAANADIELSGTEFSNGRGMTPAVKISDANGQIVWNLDDAGLGICVAAPAGFAWVPRAALDQKPTARLAPWGRLKGKITRAGKPIADWKLQFRVANVPQYATVRLSGETVLNADGAFETAFIPPVSMQVARHVQMDAHSSSSENLRAVLVAPGVTTEFLYNAPARIGEARLVWPANFKREASMKVDCGASLAPPGFRREIMTNAQSRAEFLARPEVAHALTENLFAHFKETQPNVWRAEDMQAGHWLITMSVSPKADETTSYVPPVLIASKEVDVDEGSAEVDLGEFLLAPAPQPRPHPQGASTSR